MDEHGLDRTNFKRFRCTTCKRVHAAYPLAVAERQVAWLNQCFTDNGELPQVFIDGYMHCITCGTASNQFVPAIDGDGDGEFMATLHAVVVPGAFD